MVAASMLARIAGRGFGMGRGLGRGLWMARVLGAGGSWPPPAALAPAPARSRGFFSWGPPPPSVPEPAPAAASAAGVGAAFRTHGCGALRAADAGQEVQVAGWLASTRTMGGLYFGTVRDASGALQIVCEKPAPKVASVAFMITRAMRAELAERGASPSDIKAMTPADAHAFLERARGGGGVEEEGREEEDPAAMQLLASLGAESVVRLRGRVRARPADMVNGNMPTGEVELVVEEAVVLNAARPLPLQLADAEGTSSSAEDHALRYRYLQLRRPHLQSNLRARAAVAAAVRRHLAEREGMLEVETPTLFRSTPEGAREFLVPTRTPGQFYALPQSPQQYKQLLMAGGVEKYFQIARCYRDEGGRSDRQPEFTQIDLEASFVDADDVMAITERLVRAVWADVLGREIEEIPRMSFAEAMGKFGCDKPDLRLPKWVMPRVTGVFETGGPRFLAAAAAGGGSVRALRAPQAAAVLGEKRLLAAAGEGVSTVLVKPGGKWRSAVAKHLSPEQQGQLAAALGGLEEGDAVFLAAGDSDASARRPLARARTAIASMMQEEGALAVLSRGAGGDFKFLWVTDFPLFESEEPEESEDGAGGEGRWASTHHPFTAPAPGDEALVRSDPGKARGLHYDLVLNGVELGGGSIRIHDAELQRYIMEDVLHLPPAAVKGFEHLLGALSHGCPPHGGIALGLDRLVASVVGAESLREVIAFPKSAAGREPMTGAPSSPSRAQLEEYHIQVPGSR